MLGSASHMLHLQVSRLSWLYFAIQHYLILFQVARSRRSTAGLPSFLQWIRGPVVKSSVCQVVCRMPGHSNGLGGDFNLESQFGHCWHPNKLWGRNSKALSLRRHKSYFWNEMKCYVVQVFKWLTTIDHSSQWDKIKIAHFCWQYCPRLILPLREEVT